MSHFVSGIMPSGVVLPYAGSTVPAGWLLCAGQAVSRTDFAGLFTAIGTTYGVGDGSTTLNLPDLRGRVVAGRDDMGGTAANRLTSGGSGITGTTLGAAGGAQTHALSQAEMPSHSHTQQGSFVSGNQSADHTHTFSGTTGGMNANVSHTHTSFDAYRTPVNTRVGGGTLSGGTDSTTFTDTARTTTAANVDHGHEYSGTTSGMSASHTHTTTISGVTTSTGSDGAHQNTQPTIILNYIVKV